LPAHRPSGGFAGGRNAVRGAEPPGPPTPTPSRPGSTPKLGLEARIGPGAHSQDGNTVRRNPSPQSLARQYFLIGPTIFYWSDAHRLAT
jgi:hypothetical protein